MSHVAQMSHVALRDLFCVFAISLFKKKSGEDILRPFQVLLNPNEVAKNTESFNSQAL